VGREPRLLGGRQGHRRQDVRPYRPVRARPPSRAANQQPATSNQQLLLSYSAGPARYAELLERDGLVPAPYMARIFWVAAERWDVFSDAEWKRELHAAHEITLAKLPKKVRATLALPVAQQRHLIVEARRKLAKKS